MSEKSRRPEERVRLHVVSWPEATLSVFSAIILACVLLVILTIAGGIVTVALERFSSPRRPVSTLLLLLGIVPLSIALSLPVLLVYARLAAWRIRRRSKGRWRRLSEMLKHPESAHRYPHRAIEHAFYSAPHSAKRCLASFKTCRPNHLIIRDALKPGDPNIPKPNHIPFEPIDLQKDPERAAEYFIASMHTQDVHVEFGPNPPKASRPIAARIRSVLAKAKWLLWKMLWILSFALMVYQTIRYGWRSSTFYWGIILFMWLWTLTSYLFYEYRWWSVPGGLVCREFRLWRSKMKVYHFTPKTTPLILDCRTARGYVLCEGKPMRFRLAHLNWWVVAAAWMSAATPPTMEQIESFIGEKTVLGHKGHRPLAGDV